MFLSLWLFVEFVFLGQKLWFSDLKVIAIQITVPSISVWIMWSSNNISILTWVQLVHHLWHKRRTGQKQNKEVKYEMKRKENELTKLKLLSCWQFSHLFSFGSDYVMYYIIVWWYSWKHRLVWILVWQSRALVGSSDFSHGRELQNSFVRSNFVSDKAQKKKYTKKTQRCSFSSFLHQ